MSVISEHVRLLSSEQLRAARAALRWEQSTLAERSGISVETIKRLERVEGGFTKTRLGTLSALQKAFEGTRIRFTTSDKTTGIEIVDLPED